MVAPYHERAHPITIRQLSALEFLALLPELVDLFLETVNGGSPLGFLAPITHDTVRGYLISLIPEVETGSRLVLIAYRNNAVVGSGQLALSRRSNSPHRAELERLFVERASRGQGIGRSLMHALHSVARQNGRTLILLNTRRGEPAEAFYKGLGYREVGVIPGWTIGADGERYDHVTLYQELTPVN
jgi:GNAT superfamily N-acetyltransferase